MSDAEQGESAGPSRLMTSGEVGRIFRVDPKTVTRWAAAGRIPSILTPGGHRRYRSHEIEKLLGRDRDELQS